VSLKKTMPDRACSVTGVREIASPTDPQLGLAYVHLGMVSVEADEDRAFNFGPLETVAVILCGVAEVAWEDEDGVERRETIGGRRDVFDGPPWAFFAHPFTTFEVKGLSPFVEMALVRAEQPGPDTDCLYECGCVEGGCETMEMRAGAEEIVCGRELRLGCGVEIISPDEVVCRKLGEGAWERTVSTIVGAKTSAGARRLIVGESMACRGNWLAYPGHKHDEDVLGEETRLEEVCHFRFRPERGFGMGRVYSPKRRFDQSYTIENGDTLAIPFGYHTFAVAPGYDAYCLWALGGERRQLLLREDERHAWVRHIGR